MKITLKGRPGKFIEQGKVVVTLMSQSTPPTLPKELPYPGDNPTLFMVYIRLTQWNAFKDSLKGDESDILVVEGITYYDKTLKLLAVFSVHTTTLVLQTAEREANRAKMAALAAQKALENPPEEELSFDFDE